MTRPAEIIYCPDLDAMLARATEYAAAGYQLDASNRADGAMYQPEIIAYTPAATVILRLHAMAEGTHYTRRTRAFNAAEALIAAAQSAVQRAAIAASQPAQCSAMAAEHIIPDGDGYKSVLGYWQTLTEEGPAFWHPEAAAWQASLTPECLVTEDELDTPPTACNGWATPPRYTPYARYGAPPKPPKPTKPTRATKL